MGVICIKGRVIEGVSPFTPGGIHRQDTRMAQHHLTAPFGQFPARRIRLDRAGGVEGVYDLREDAGGVIELTFALISICKIFQV